MWAAVVRKSLLSPAAGCARTIGSSMITSAPPAMLPGATQVATPFADADADIDSPTARDSFQLMAVPKKKPSHARRRIRQHGQRLLEERKNPIVNWKPCPGCGMPLRPHFMCLKCHKFF